MICTLSSAHWQHRLQSVLTLESALSMPQQHGVTAVTITGGRTEVLRSLKHYLRAQSQGHHTIDRLQERGVKRGSITQRSSLRGR